MIVYLTSSPGGNMKKDGRRYPTSFNPANDFVENLKKDWKENSRVLIVSADPMDTAVNDSIKGTFEQSFPMSGLSLHSIDLCDSRNPQIVERIKEYEVVILAGGHVPTQNDFFEEIELRKWIQNFEGILIGISAGTMNCAKNVYALPELEGESKDPEYKRFLSGLGITNYRILPHFQEVKDETLDGKQVIREIACPDSLGKEFYALVDGSYIRIEGDKTILYGEGDRIKDGEIEQICRQGNHLSLD